MNRIILALLAQNTGSGGGGGGSGTVTNVSVETANGFTGAVALANTTPQITLGTTLTGLLRGTGTGLASIPSLASAVLATNGSSVISFVTTLPSVNSGLTLVTNPVTTTITSLNTALADIDSGSRGLGTVTNVSGTSINGFNINITNPTTIPNITLTVPLTGLLQSNGTAMSAVPVIANAMLASNGSSVLSFVTTLPAVNSGSTLVTNPITTSITSLNTALSDLSTGIPGGGTVTNVSVITTNGFGGTVSTSTTTPQITLRTTLTGLLRGNGTAMQAIVPVATSVLASNGSNVMSFVTTLPAVNAGSTLVFNPKTSLITSLDTALLDLSVSGPGLGTVTNFVFVNGNGFIGYVTTPTSVPTLTLSTALNTMIKGNGTAFVNAISGTDYVIPSGNVATATALQTSRLIYGNPFNGSSDVTGAIAVTFGGLGLSSTMPYSLFAGGVTGTSALQQVSSVGVIGQVLTSAGPGALPGWQDATSVAGGIDPYNPSRAIPYAEGEYISGDGTNGILGAIYVSVQGGITGPFSQALWACIFALSLSSLPDMNSFSGTVTLPDSIIGIQNSFSGLNCGNTPILSGSNNSAGGTLAFRSNFEISGEKNTAYGLLSMGGGNLTTASFNTNLGYGSGYGSTTCTYNLNLGYLAGQNIDEGVGNINIGGASGSAGAYNHNLEIANPFNSNSIIFIEDTETPIAPGMVLATSATVAGALSPRPLTSADILSYSQSFNATTDWGAPSGGIYTISIPSVTHGQGVNVVNIQIFETSGANLILTTVDQVVINSTNGDVSFNVTETPDARFAGKIFIIGAA